MGCVLTLEESDKSSPSGITAFFSNLSSRTAYSKRSLFTETFALSIARVATLLLSSTSSILFFKSLHFCLYSCSIRSVRTKDPLDSTLR